MGPLGLGSLLPNSVILGLFFNLPTLPFLLCKMEALRVPNSRGHNTDSTVILINDNSS